jgi:hypothetical protein
MPNGQRPTARARRLRLDLIFPPLADSLEDIVVHVIVEDLGEADAPAPLLHRRDFPSLRIGQERLVQTLELDLPDLATAALPVIRVHVDRSGSGAIRAGDFINPEIVEVPAAGQERCRIPLVEVR